jgi:uncharacterized membrane protein
MRSEVGMGISSKFSMAFVARSSARFGGTEAQLDKSRRGAYDRGLFAAIAKGFRMEFDVVGLLFRWMHILAAVTAAGGTIFMRLALLPAMATLGDEPRKKLHEQIRSRWLVPVIVSIAFLLVSGLYNYVVMIQRYDLRALKFYHPLIGTKILLALGVFFIASALVGRGKATEPMRANRKFWLTLNAVLVVIVILISGVLRTAEKKLKPAAGIEGHVPIASIALDGAAA